MPEAPFLADRARRVFGIAQILYRVWRATRLLPIGALEIEHVFQREIALQQLQRAGFNRRLFTRAGLLAKINAF